MESKAIIVINTTSTYYRRMRDKGFDLPPQSIVPQISYPEAVEKITAFTGN